MNIRAALLCALAISLAAPTAALAAPAAEGEAAPKVEDSPVQVVPDLPPSGDYWKIDPAATRAPIAPRRFVRERSGIFGGQRIKYQLIAEDSIIRSGAGEPLGSIFSFTYQAKSTAGVQRPVVFIFNGGPGSSSIWLHMGILGPKKAAFRDIEPRQVPPFELASNPDSLLAVADLVFIDPIGTGFSRYWGAGRPSNFYGAEEDAGSMVLFIQSWLRKHGRWNSPKFLLGESYGTTRAALLSRRLMGGVLDGTLKGVSLNGVIFVGGDGELANPQGNEKFLPTFSTLAATAWHHQRADRAGREFDSFIADANRFAHEQLLPALDRWESLSADERTSIAEQHARFTGLKTSYLLEKRLRVMPSDYAAELLADQGKTLGFYDSRYTLPAANSLGDPVADDPAMGQYTPVFVGALNSYLREDLGIEIDDDYVVIDFANVNFPFSRAPSVVEGKAIPGQDPGADLAAAMRRNPDLYFMSIQGWFDLFGAVGTAEYGIAQRRLPLERVVAKHYVSGHMAYVGEAGPKMAADLKQFILTASKGRPQ